MRRLVLTLSVALAVAVAAGAAERVKSGPQAGEQVPGPFHPLNLTGPEAGNEACLYCRYGQQPVAAIFAKEPSEQVGRLLKALDAVTAPERDKGLRSYVVFTTADKAAAREYAGRADLKNLVVSTMPECPKDYEIAKDADVTVLLYVKGVVKANHAFKKGDLNDTAIDAVVKDTEKVAPRN